MPYDLIVRNGKIIDGSGLPGFHGDVAVSGGRIVEIGKVSGEGAPVLDPTLFPLCGGPRDNNQYSRLTLSLSETILATLF
jgi:cytosine/adenosine deaminase-related metal-dependent hydrolase